jgi:hypothetical protein
MGSIKLHIEPIVYTVKKIATKCTQINNSTFNNVITLITLVCNSTSSKYKVDDRLKVRVTKGDIDQSFLYGTGAQGFCMPFTTFNQTQKLLEKDLYIKDAGGNNLVYKSTYQVTMQILGRKVMSDLVVLENVHNKTLGIYFIHQ